MPPSTRAGFVPGLPPTPVMARARDPLPSIDTARRFVRALAAKGVDVRFIAFPYAGHNFNTTDDGIPNQPVRQVARFPKDADTHRVR